LASEHRPHLTWQAWPARDRPLAAAGTAIFVVLVSVLVAGVGGHVVVGLGAVVILFGSLNPFFSPTTFRLDDEGVTVERWPVRKVRAWTEFRAAWADRYGVTLSPFRGRSWMEPYRGVRLLFAGNREAVVDAVRGRLVEGVELVEMARSGPARRGGEGTAGDRSSRSDAGERRGDQ
jgi:hypothetical protein